MKYIMFIILFMSWVYEASMGHMYYGPSLWRLGRDGCTIHGTKIAVCGGFWSGTAFLHDGGRSLPALLYVSLYEFFFFFLAIGHWIVQDYLDLSLLLYAPPWLNLVKASLYDPPLLNFMRASCWLCFSGHTGFFINKIVK